MTKCSERLLNWQETACRYPLRKIDAAAYKIPGEVYRRKIDFSETNTELAVELRSRIRGEVRVDAGSRAFYATDASNYPARFQSASFAQLTDRRALHTAQVLQMALDGGTRQTGPYVESAIVERTRRERERSQRRAAAIMGAAALVGGALHWAAMRRRKP